MNNIKIINQHILIRNTIGYELLSKTDVYDISILLSFLTVVDNYCKMKKHVNKSRTQENIQSSR